MFSGGEFMRMCGFLAFFRYGIQACEQANVPRALTPCIRSQRFIGVEVVPVRLMALALFTRMSMPPKVSTVFCTAAAIWFSSRMSTMHGRALPPAFTISSAAEWIVPGSLGCGSEVLAAMAMFAPSRAARSAMARPMPRLAPVMNNVLPCSDAMFELLARLRSAYDKIPGTGRQPKMLTVEDH